MAAGDEVAVRYTLRTAEFLATWARLHIQRRSAWTQTAFVSACVAIVAGLTSPTPEVVLAAALGGMAAWLCLALFLVPWVIWRLSPVIRGERVDRFTDEGMVQEVPGARFAVDWTHWSGVRRVGRVYALIGTEVGYTSVPRRAFGSGDDERRFCELVAKHLGMAPDDFDRSVPRAGPAPTGGPPSAAPATVAGPGEVAVAFALDHSEAAYLARHIVGDRRRPWIRATGVVVVGLFFAGFRAVGAEGTIVGTLIGWLLPVILFVFFYLLIDARSRPRSLARRLWSHGEATLQHFATHGTAVRTDHTEVHADWGWFKRAARVGDAYVLTTRAGDHWVTPRRAFASAEAEQRYRELVAAHVGTL
jgi:F0F1-type ATP synthase assembly protein I